jgi:hypothetical protein
VLAETADHHPFDGGAEQGVIHHCGVLFCSRRSRLAWTRLC